MDEQQIHEREISLPSDEAHALMKLGCRVAEQKGYPNNGTADMHCNPTEQHPDVVVVGVAVSRRYISREEVHVVLRIIRDEKGRRARTLDVHEGPARWGSYHAPSPCLTCRKWYEESEG